MSRPEESSGGDSFSVTAFILEDNFGDGFSSGDSSFYIQISVQDCVRGDSDRASDFCCRVLDSGEVEDLVHFRDNNELNPFGSYTFRVRDFVYNSLLLKVSCMK